jgi:hypothetical protein
MASLATINTLIAMAVEWSPHRARVESVPDSRQNRLLGGGTEGNELLTNATGAVLIAMLAVLGLTIINLRGLLWLHLFLGIALLGPLVLKMASTGYRFARYYTHNAAYRVKGAPLAPLRMLAPLVVLTSVIVFATGVALLFTGPAERPTLLPIHKISFIVWIAVTAVHVLAHLPGMPAALRADYATATQLRSDVAGRAGRMIVLAGAIVAGLVLAVLLIPEFASWTHWNAVFHHGHDH